MTKQKNRKFKPCLDSRILFIVKLVIIFTKRKFMKSNTNYIFFIYIFVLHIFKIESTEEYQLPKDRIIYNKNSKNINSNYEWTIIGAGPAGIIAVTILLDLGINPKSIAWVDPLFNVGRIGQFYNTVTGNTANKYYINLLQSSPIIEKITKDDIAYLKTLDPDGFNTLEIISSPLQKVTKYLQDIVSIKIGYTESLEFFDSMWHVTVQQNQFSSKNVILATGSAPIKEKYEENNFAEVIPLDYALNLEILKKIITEKDTVALFGGSHSAILILKYLSEMPVKQIFNFYRHPLLYAIDMGDWTLNSTNGLKGETAKWAREVLEKNPPTNLIRIKNTEDNRKQFLSQCTKIIYAIGYKPNLLPTITTNGIPMEEIHFDPESGIIGPRLFGIGLAFPGSYYDLQGNKEQLIGLNSFMQYALYMLPEWIDIKSENYKNMIIRILDELKILENIVQISVL